MDFVALTILYSQQLTLKYESSQSKLQEHLARLNEVDRLLEQRTHELEAARLNLSTSSRDSVKSSDGRDSTSNLRQQITGLKYVFLQTLPSTVLPHSSASFIGMSYRSSRKRTVPSNRQTKFSILITSN